MSAPQCDLQQPQPKPEQVKGLTFSNNSDRAAIAKAGGEV